VSALTATEITVHADGQSLVAATSLSVSAGTWHTIVGPNGAGKSSLVEAVAGVRNVSIGRVDVFGHDVHRLREASRARQIAFVPQQPIVPWGMSVEDYVSLGRTAHRGVIRIGRDDDHQIVNEVLDRVGIANFAHRDVASLSGGERQRVVLARALAQHTLVLVLDEPTTGLDVRHQVEILQLVRREVDECGLAVLATLHDLSLAAQFSDVMSVMSQGALMTSGPPSEVLRSRALEECYGVDFRVVEIDGADVVVPHVVRDGMNQSIS
jgi:iron complex transport system ATP-binding protein